jgi:hypothetical protein
MVRPEIVFETSGFPFSSYQSTVPKRLNMKRAIVQESLATLDVIVGGAGCEATCCRQLTLAIESLRAHYSRFFDTGLHTILYDIAAAELQMLESVWGASPSLLENCAGRMKTLLGRYGVELCRTSSATLMRLDRQHGAALVERFPELLPHVRGLKNEEQRLKEQQREQAQLAARRAAGRDAVLEFPGEDSLGQLYARRYGRKRWRKLGDARGRIALEPDSEYKLRLSNFVFVPESIVRSLAGVNCDLLTEIEIPVQVPEKDWWDQAVCGDSWLQRLVEREKAQVRAALRTLARLVFTLELVNY